MPPERANGSPVEPSRPGAPDVVELVTPVGREWDSVARLVLAGIADRMHLSVEELDDLQLALERLLLETGPADEEVRIVFDVEPAGRVRLRVGPLRERSLEADLRGQRTAAGRLDLCRILATVVDSFDVEDGADGGVVVNLEKLGRGH